MEKKKLNTTEILGFIIVGFCIVYLEQIFILSVLDKAQVLETLGVALVTTILGAAIGLCVKSWGEKASANKNKINHKTGLPFDMEAGEEREENR